MANQLFEDVFNKASIYEMLFFNVKSVLIYSTLKDLEEKNKPLFDSWKYLAKIKYGFDMDVIHSIAGTMTDETPIYAQKIYEENAPNYPEYSRIITITYATLYVERGTLKRSLKKFTGENEYNIIEQFMDILHQLSSDGELSTPKNFPLLCGHNIISYDIPLLIKRFIINKNKFETNKELPLILKKSLIMKPWESGIIDTINVWKFNGYDYMPLMLISDFMNLKRTVDLLSNNELSKYYWNNVVEKPEETLEFISLQSATQTNLVIQLMNELRQL
jgi:hypothetical protein